MAIEIFNNFSNSVETATIYFSLKEMKLSKDSDFYKLFSEQCDQIILKNFINNYKEQKNIKKFLIIIDDIQLIFQQVENPYYVFGPIIGLQEKFTIQFFFVSSQNSISDKIMYLIYYK